MTRLNKSKIKHRPKQPDTADTALVAAHQLVFEAIGTHWQIDLVCTSPQLSDLKVDVAKRIEQFDKTYSRFRPDSLVTAMSVKPGKYTMPPDAVRLISFYRDLYGVTGGSVTPLIGQVMSDAGYDAAYSLQPGRLSQPPTWEEVINFTSPVLQLARPALLDFGAAGKGYLVDLIVEMLESAGVTDYCVDAGGDMRVANSKERLTIGLEHPDDPAQVIGVVQLDKGSVCGSAGNRRRWADFHHTINPVTLTSPDHVKAVWVIADQAMIADGLATALFFVGPAVLQQWQFGYCIVTGANDVQVSANFPGQIFSS